MSLGSRIAMTSAALCTGLLVGSCSLVGLDRFDFPSGEDGCRQLNVRDGLWEGDIATGRLRDGVCRAWSAAPSGSCTFRPRDDDRDGASPATCEGGTDCNDNSAQAFSGNPESCDGIDNDCNGIVDDVGLGIAAQPPVRVLAGVGSPNHVAYAENWTSDPTQAPDGIAVTWATGSTTGFEIVDDIATPVSVGSGLGASTNEDPLRFLGANVVNGCGASTLERGAGVLACNPTLEANYTGPVDCTQADRTAARMTDGCAGSLECVRTIDGRDICAQCLTQAAPAADDCRTHADCSDGIFCNGEEQCDPAGWATGDGCRVGMPPSCVETGQACQPDIDACLYLSVANPCTFAESAVAPLGVSESGGTSRVDFGGLVVATNGCSAGLVRAGFFQDEGDTSNPTRYPGRSLLMLGDDRRSSSWLGIDRSTSNAALQCTGESRSSGVLGASGLAMSSLRAAPASDRFRPQALAGWAAAPQCRITGGMCSFTGNSAAIEVIGLWFEEGNFGGNRKAGWMLASNRGSGERFAQPLVLSASSRSLRPSIRSFDVGGSAGWLVGFANGTGSEVELHFVSALPDPAINCPPAGDAGMADAGGGPVMSNPCLFPFPPYETRVNSSDPQVRTTPALTSEALSVSLTGTGITNVVVETGRVSGSSVEIAVAYATRNMVSVARFELEPAQRSLTPIGSVVTVNATGEVRDLGMAHVPSGFLSQASTVMGQLVGADDTGGFVVTWTTPSATLAARVSDLVGLLEPQVMSLGASSRFVQPFTDTDATGRLVGVRAIAHAGDSFVVFPSICGR